MSRTWGESVLDAVIDQEVQIGWTQGEPQTHPDDLRMLLAKRRRNTAAQYRELQETPSFQDVFADVRTYFNRVIPRPSTTDGRFWTVSARPITNRTRKDQRLVTITCGKVETLVIIEDRSTHETWWFINLEHGALKKSDLPKELRECLSTTGWYRSAGHVDVIDEGVAGSLADWFDDTPGMEIAARQLALNLMRKGTSWFARWHCDELVDERCECRRLGVRAGVSLFRLSSRPRRSVVSRPSGGHHSPPGRAAAGERRRCDAQGWANCCTPA